MSNPEVSVKLKFAENKREMHEQLVIQTDEGRSVGSLHHWSSLRMGLTVILELSLIVPWGREMAYVAS